jgi:hypothetical protein
MCERTNCGMLAKNKQADFPVKGKNTGYNHLNYPSWLLVSESGAQICKKFGNIYKGVHLAVTFI